MPIIPEERIRDLEIAVARLQILVVLSLALNGYAVTAGAGMV